MWQMWTLKQLLHRWMQNNRKMTGKPGRSSLIWLFRLQESFFGGSERYALEKGFPGLRVSDAETLSLQKSAKSSVKNTELASLRQLYF